MEIKSAFKTFIESPTLKAFTIGILALILYGASFLIHDVIRERKSLQKSAEREISQKWGGEQYTTGPILSVPYYWYEQVTDKKKEKKKGSLLLFPQTLNVTSEITPEPRKRGIYEVNTFKSNSEISGTFDINLPSEEGRTYELDKTTINYGIENPKGISELLKSKVNGILIPLTPNNKNRNLEGNFFGATIDLTDIKELSYDFKLPLNGTNKFFIVPTAAMTNFKVNSTWPHPKFDGSSLPIQREVSEKGFSATWKVNDVSGNYLDPLYSSFKGGYKLHEKAIGVDLIKPIDEYQKNFRSIKYALLTISLTFLAFFLIEVINKLKIHPIQYLLVGIGLVIYYALLVALSEHLGFNIAYAVASLTILSLVTFYAYYMIQKGWKLALLIGLLVTGIYGFVFTTLQLEKFALLFGSIGLVIVLAITMYITRNINWYNTSSLPKE